ncbi:DUF4834 family protein [Pontibacter liquoris]|uniref:DUF4834 family protein n=1 Tax=Pontibacter liquoris TaxID=2905677 RepID=UPI001FA6C72E|nr:DUF4834 family protein [Pontibacter liquoris]
MIKFIFTTLLIIFIMRTIAPVLFRWLLGAFVKKSMRNGTFFYPNQQQQQRPYQEPGRSNGQPNGRSTGHVKIDYIPDQPGQRHFDGGEYVDYEEVK